jgi:hypothetical protein
MNVLRRGERNIRYGVLTMCKSKDDGGQRCLSHMSYEVSNAFGDAYKDLGHARDGVRKAGGPTTAFNEAQAACRQALRDARDVDGVDPQITHAAKVALDASIADTLMSAHKTALADLGVKPDSTFLAHRQTLREARAAAQANLQAALAGEQPTDAPEAEADNDPAPAPAAFEGSGPADPFGAPTGINTHGFTVDMDAEFAKMAAMPDTSAPTFPIQPGVSSGVLDCGAGRYVTIEDQRDEGGIPLTVDKAALSAALDATEAGPGSYKVFLATQPSEMPSSGGFAGITPEGERVIIVGVKAKDSYPDAALYAFNNTVLQGFRTSALIDKAHATGEQQHADMNLYGRLADHTGEKEVAQGYAHGLGSKVWAFKSSPTQP